MNQETQAQGQQMQQPQIRIGFEATLDMFNPNWRTEFTPPQVDAFRFFYQSALRDFTPFLASHRQTLENMIQAYQFMDVNAAQTTNVVQPPAAPAGDTTDVADNGKAKATKPAKTKAPAKPVTKGKAKR
jgi:hypothetical protein